MPGGISGEFRFPIVIQHLFQFTMQNIEIGFTSLSFALCLNPSAFQPKSKAM